MSIEAKSQRPPDSWPLAVLSLIIRVAVIVALLYVLYRVGFIIVMVLMAVMLALTVAPIVDWLSHSSLLRAFNHHARRVTATVLVFIGLALALVGLVVMIIRPLSHEIRQFVEKRDTFQAQTTARLTALQTQYEQAVPDKETRLWIESQGQKWIQEQGGKDLGALVTRQLQHVLHGTLESGMLLVELILIPVLAFSFLTESRPLKREFAQLLPRTRVRDGLYILEQTRAILQSYSIGQLILALIAGVVVWILMTMLGSQYALALAVIAAVTRVIPVVGPLIGGIPIVLISTLQGWDQGLLVLIAFTFMHLIESKVVMPRIIGYRINLHPAVVIIVLLIGAEFFGMWGMFLAAPVAAVGKVMLHYFLVRPRLRNAPPGPPPVAPVSHKELDVERPAPAGVRSHSGAL